MTTYERIKAIKQREEYQLLEHDEIAKDILYLKNDEKRSYNGYNIGYHAPASANWGYDVEIISFNGRLYEIVKQFGTIKHAAYISIYNYYKEA